MRKHLAERKRTLRSIYLGLLESALRVSSNPSSGATKVFTPVSYS